MHHRLVFAGSLFFTGLMLATIGTAFASPGTDTVPPSGGYTTAAEYSPDAQECAFLTIINDYRAQNGKAPLTLLRTLGAAAKHHSVDMATRNYFSHTAPPTTAGGASTTFDQNIIDHGYNWRTIPAGVGENIAAGNSTAQGTFEQWRTSPGHNDNMLGVRSDFKAIGIGRAYNATSTYGWYWTTTFGTVVTGEAVDCGGGTNATAIPTATPTLTSTASRTPTPTSTATRTPTSTPAATRTPTRTPTSTPTRTQTPAATLTTAPTKTRTPTPRPTVTRTPTRTRTPIPIKTPTRPALPTRTPAA
ncbi:MAG: hypothetical protein QOF01_937 [Thermomicrobiales bacterium]|jgi:uncharacterized protein YkwD|nr:hypothetical protein [Thermomicrobiales bacterium]